MFSPWRLRRQHIPTQCVAAFWLAFYAIAALRSVVPGACETQACVLERAEAARAASGEHACCAQTPDDSLRVTAPHAPHDPHCAMCTLMTAPSHAGPAVHQPPANLAPARSLPEPESFQVELAPNPGGPRAPPSHSFIA